MKRLGYTCCHVDVLNISYPVLDLALNNENGFKRKAVGIRISITPFIMWNGSVAKISGGDFLFFSCSKCIINIR